MYFVPFGVIIGCTLLTVKKLFVRQTFENDQLARNAQRNRRISLMLLLMCFAYIICTLPNRLCFSLFMDQLIGHDYTDTVFLATNTLMYTRNAINIFFLYISVSGFRQIMRQFILMILRKISNRVDPENQMSTRNGGSNTNTNIKHIKTATQTITHE